MRILRPLLTTAACCAVLSGTAAAQERRESRALSVNPVGLARQAVQAGYEQSHGASAYGLTFGWFHEQGGKDARYDYQSLDATYRWSPAGDPFHGLYLGATAGAANLALRTDYFFGGRAETVKRSSALSGGVLAGYVLSGRGPVAPTLNLGGGVRYLHKLSAGARDDWSESPRLLPIVRLELGMKF